MFDSLKPLVTGDDGKIADGEAAAVVVIDGSGRPIWRYTVPPSGLDLSVRAGRITEHREPTTTERREWRF